MGNEGVSGREGYRGTGGRDVGVRRRMGGEGEECGEKNEGS